MKLAEFNQGPRHTGWYWVRHRPNGQVTPAFAVMVYASGRTPHNWSAAGWNGWRTADELHIEEVFEYLGTSPAAAKDAGVASTPPPVIPSAELSPPPAAIPNGLAIPNGFRDLPPIPDREIMDEVPLKSSRRNRSAFGDHPEPLRNIPTPPKPVEPSDHEN